MPTRKRLYNNLLGNLDCNTDIHDTGNLQKHIQAQPLPPKTKADIFISALLYGALERI